MASFFTLWLTGLCSGYRILDSKYRPRSRSLVGRSGAILGRKCFKIEVLGNDISGIPRPSQSVIMAQYFLIKAVFNLDPPRGPWWKTALHLRCVQTRKKSCLLFSEAFLPCYSLTNQFHFSIFANSNLFRNCTIFPQWTVSKNTFPFFPCNKIFTSLTHLSTFCKKKRIDG